MRSVRVANPHRVGGLLLGLFSVSRVAFAQPPPSQPAPPAAISEKYQQARSLVSANRCPDAIPMFREIAEHPSGANLALFSAKLLFDCEVRSHSTELLAQDGVKLCALPSLLQDEEFKKQCAAIESGLARHSMESLVQAGATKKAAELAIEFADRHPEDLKLDELLYNASIWFDSAGDIVSAQRSRFRLLAVRPESPLAMRALYASAQQYEKVGAYDRAASCFEEFAGKQPSDRLRAVSALQSALAHRINLGDAARAQSDMDQFLKRYGTEPSQRETAAEMFLGLSRVYEGPTQRKNLEAHLREYLRAFAKAGGVPSEIVATARLAELIWERSCPVPMYDGLCASRRVAKEQNPKPSVLKRIPALEKEALTMFERVVGLSHGLSSAETRPHPPSLALTSDATSAAATTTIDQNPQSTARKDRAMLAAQRVLLLQADAAYEQSLRGTK